MVRYQAERHVKRTRVIKYKNGNALTNEEIVLKRWREYFKEVMNEENEREKWLEEVKKL